jgi:pyruvate,orthophosphate dikinase
VPSFPHEVGTLHLRNCTVLYGRVQAAEGVLTLKDGPGSHTAVAMRGMGKSAVVGAQDIILDPQGGSMSSALRPDGLSVQAGDTITIDGSTGLVYLGEMPTTAVGLNDNFRTVMQWADKYRHLRVMASTEGADQVQQAQRMGAEGIGLCRTEHMFLSSDRINLFRQAILAESAHHRSGWLHQLLPLQQAEFLDMFRAVGNGQVCIRLLDMPICDFLPCPEADLFEQQLGQLAEDLQLTVEDCRERVLQLQESNPALGLRGCRLSILYPEVTEMQTKAIVGTLLLSAPHSK